MADIAREDAPPAAQKTILPDKPEVQECQRALWDGSTAPRKIRLTEGATLRKLGRQEAGWHALFTGSDGASLLQYSLVMDSKEELTPDMVQLALEELQRLVLGHHEHGRVEGVRWRNCANVTSSCYFSLVTFNLRKQRYFTLIKLFYVIS